MRRFDWRYAGVWVFILAMAGVSVYFLFLADGEPIAQPTPTPSTTAAASPTSSPTTSPTPLATATTSLSPTPLPDYTPTELPVGDNMMEVVQTIFDIRNDAFTLRDRTILGEIYDSRCSCSSRDQESIKTLVEDDQMYAGGTPRVTSIEIDRANDQGGDDDVILDAVVEFSDAEIRDRDGQFVRTEAGATVTIRMVLLRDLRPDQRWIALGAEPVARTSR